MRTMRCGALAVLMLLALAARAQGQFAGKVLAADGRPVAGARVRLYYFHDPSGFGCQWLTETKSDEQGAFRLAEATFAPPLALLGPSEGIGLYLVAAHPDHAVGVAPVIRERKDGYELWLDRARTVQCTVRNNAGEPVPDAQVTVLMAAEAFAVPASFSQGSGYANRAIQTIVRESTRVVTGEDGKARLMHVPFGRSVWLEAVAPAQGLGRAVLHGKEAEAAFTLNFPVTLVKGQVRAANGAPLAGIVVASAYATNTALRSYALTDAEGRYELAALPGRGAMTPTLVALDPSPQPRYAATVFRPAGGEQLTYDFALAPGTRVAGRVLEADANKPVAGAVVLAYLTAAGGGSASLYRLSDAEGRYDFCLPGPRASLRTDIARSVVPPADDLRLAGGRASLRVRGAPNGLAQRDVPRLRSVNLDRDSTNNDLLVQLTPTSRRKLVVKGQVEDAGGAQVVAFQKGLRNSQPGGANGRGEAEIAGFAAESPLHVYAFSRDERLAGYLVAQPALLAADAPLEIELQPTQAAEVALQDARGRNLTGSVNLYLTMPENDVLRVAGPVDVPDLAGELVARLHLLPGLDYEVNGYSRWHEPAAPARRLKLRAEAGRALPQQALKFRRLDVPGTRPARTEADFQRELETLRDARWKKEDPVEKRLTWYATSEGLAVADGERREVKRLNDLLGVQKFTVSAIAFAPGKVWLGTDKGLFAWDRQDEYWTRFAVGGELVEAAVSELALDEAGRLTVTVRAPDGKERKHLYDPAKARWQEAR